MRDLDLCHRLDSGTDVRVDELTALAAWPLARRAWLLGRLAKLATHAEPALRAAALAAMAGSRGVPGLRVIVGALADPDERVRGAALEALRVAARDAPFRYTHALFHRDEAVRRAALVDVPRGALEIAGYLRADAACAALAKEMPWPDSPLPLAIDLHARGSITDEELVAVVVNLPATAIQTYVAAGLRRSAEQVEAYFEAIAHTRTWSAGHVPAPGHDELDQIAGAFARTSELQAQHLVYALAPRKDRALARRAAAACVAALAKSSRPAAEQPLLVAMAVALEPRLLALVPWEPALAREVARRFPAFRWPVRPTKEQVDRLLQLPHVQADLQLAVGVTGLHSSARLKRLAHALQEEAIVAKLAASDDGWTEICQLPGETPALEVRWLARIEPLYPERYVALVARALSIFHGKRLGNFIDQIQRRHRSAAFVAYARGNHRPAVEALATAHDGRVASVCEAYAKRLDREGLIAILDALLAPPDATADTARVALALVRQVAEKSLASAARGIGDAAALALVALVDGTDPLPRDRELAIAKVFAERTEPTLREWGSRVGTVVEPRPPPPPPPPPVARRDLDAGQQHAIASCADEDLTDVVAIARDAPTRGLTAALARRTPAPNLAACVALLGSVDPLEEIAALLDRFERPGPGFEAQLDEATLKSWLRKPVPALANARLFRWEEHTFQLAKWIVESGGVLAVLQAIDALPGHLARHTLWRGIADVVLVWRYRDKPQFEREATRELAVFAAERIDRDIGVHASKLLVALVEARAVPAADVRPIVLARAADSSAAAREVLVRIARLDGIPEPPREATPVALDEIAQIRSTKIVEQLVAWCRESRPAIVQEAVLALLVLGEPGLAALAGLLDELSTLLAPRPLLASIPLWDDGPAIARARVLADTGELPPGWQFELCLALVERGDGDGYLDRAIAAARAPSSEAWFTRKDWERLVERRPALECAIALVDSPHHHAYQPAATHLIEEWTSDDRIRDALVAFLEVDGERPLHLRRLAARRLAANYDSIVGLPILIEEIIDEGVANEDAVLAMLPATTYPSIAQAVVDAALIGGHSACTEKRMMSVLAAIAKALPAGWSPHAIYAQILEDASTAPARRAASQLLANERLDAARLERLAEVFAWGVRRGVELTGRLFRVHLTSQETDLGHTRLDGNRVFVSALPMLRDEMHGQDIVEGLILHELGHHAYHRGEDAQALWKQAHAEGIGHLLNLVADEHLERNLRAVDRVYGDRLKRLDAYAFHHASQEIRVQTLLSCLRASSARALIAADLEVAYDEASVRLRRGAVLQELDRGGHPLARFARALRMGLGNRSSDPVVQAALALCDRNLRNLDMRGLYELTKQLAAMFGGAVSIASVFGGAEGLEDSERDTDRFNGGIDDEVLQREVERILDPRAGKSGRMGPRDRLCLNVNPDERFDKISHVQRVRGNEAAHRKLVADVARHATRLRAHLDDLGLRYLPVGARIQGRALDKPRLKALVTRNDPRILSARTPVRSTDLFLGTVIDCSGSMQVGDNIERAKRFAALIAEAVRPLPQVEARFFGFTDSVIYDAGDAQTCDVTALVADGGNNDAAALFHAANVAAASPRRAKVLVMISDGLPTQCSVAALRGLVTTLTRRRHMVCAQVAVRPLEEECFPHYVVVDDARLDVAVARFGRMIGDLARRSLA